ncbi:MAG: CHASE domain-containing protein [Parasphingorhabdus sp.]|uniref:CHASE domain-containing protein n=1 Tax=Parasphingorhabdus sp. TaxID=2709688 RepID=UPI003003038F
MNFIPSYLALSNQRKEKLVNSVIMLSSLLGLVALLVLTIWAWKMADANTYDRNLAAFDSLAVDNAYAMQSRLNSYRQSLDGGAAIFDTMDSVSLEQWRAYVAVLNIKETLPGINGLGFVEPVRRSEINDYLQSTQDRGVDNINIHPQTDLDEIFSISYIEPIAANRAAVGLDIAFEKNRRKAAYHARDTGKATITKRIYLVQDETRSAGFLLMRPTYHQGHILKTDEQRRAAFRGWVYAPFIATRFMEDLTSSQGETLDIEVYDGRKPYATNLIFRSNADDSVRVPRYSITRTFHMMEQEWTVVWKSTPAFEARVSSREPLFILMGGMMVSVGFVLIIFFHVRRESYVRNEVKIKTEELVQKEREVSHALARAELATEAKSKFLANMSHEIRTPMNGVIGFTQLLNDDNLNEKQKRYVQMISDSGSVMMNLLNDILDISKVDAGLMEINATPIDVRHIIQNCMKMISPTAETKQIELITEVDARLPRLIKGDGLRLRQIILNLLANAVKFTDNGHVQLEARYLPTVPNGSADHQHSELWISVSDTGIGIARERQAAIFEPFRQADESTARKYGGTGLGLSISNQLVKLMGGHMSMESELLHGSVFTFRIPAENCAELNHGGLDHQDEQPDAAAALPSIRRKKTKILVAEDHDVNQMLLSEMLTNLGYDYEIADNGIDAVALVGQAREKKSQFDLVLMDIQMPYIDGLKATQIIRKDGVSAAELPIIALTANAYAQDISDCLAAGMQAHLAKPFSVEDLQDLIQKWVGARTEAQAA